MSTAILSLSKPMGFFIVSLLCSSTIAAPPPATPPIQPAVDPCGPRVQNLPEYPAQGLNTCTDMIGTPNSGQSVAPFWRKDCQLKDDPTLPELSSYECSQAIFGACNRIAGVGGGNTKTGEWVFSQYMNCTAGFFWPAGEGARSPQDFDGCMNLVMKPLQECATPSDGSSTNFGSVNVKREPGDLYQQGAFTGEQFDSGYASYMIMPTPHCQLLQPSQCGPNRQPYGGLPS